MNASEFIEWLGIELHNLLCTTDETNRLTASRDLVNRAMYILGELPPDEMARTKAALSESTKTGKIGSFRIPYDIRGEYDWIEGIMATIKV